MQKYDQNCGAIMELNFWERFGGQVQFSGPES